ncbi:unnamed protein product [Mytilus coruscus]|uniref:Uncharacterized protein n=1 Tax=Mytilus coruscus TaxID=42192 RepID=A0A6J8AB33_MYTCO|nr:unnamed protein product [Mytilus coruscus]
MTAQALINVLNPLFENQFRKSFEKSAAEALHLSPIEKSADKIKKELTLLKKNKIQIIEAISVNDRDVENFLASGKSFKQHDRERMHLYESKANAEKETKIRLEKEQKGQVVHKKHHGNFSNFTFNKEEFLVEIKFLMEIGIVNWTRLAKKYDVTNTITGNKPQNAGQVLFMFVKANGIDIMSFNKHKAVSGRDILRRVRRPKKKILKKLSIPTPRSSKNFKEVIKQKLADGTIYLGNQIARKTVISSSISKEGNLTENKVIVYSRIIGLQKIILSELSRLQKSGILLEHNDEYYDTLTEDKIRQRLQFLGEETNASCQDMRLKLKIIERTFKLKMWHDHSDILNHSYVNFMTTILYDAANFMTDNEYQTLARTTSTTNVQSIVEKPQLYILGRSASKDIDQISYTKARIEDLKQMTNKIRYGDIDLIFKLRLFSGDGPARQFEAGQQRGGNFSCICGVESKSHMNLECCYQMIPLDLEDRRKLVVEGSSWIKIKDGIINPFQNLKTEELIDELEERGVDTFHLNLKSRLQEELTSVLHGICRPPVLNEQQHDKISEDTVELIQVLVEIINIAYSSDEKRSPRQILRLYNLTFLFGVLTKSVIGTPVKITTRKLYGCHFHSLVVHLPEVYRIVNTKSILCEQEERSFGSLRRIAVTTTNRKPGWIIDNTIIRYNAQQNSDDRSDSFAKQDSIFQIHVPCTAPEQEK